MSQKLVDRNPDLKRLRDKGYDVDIDVVTGYLTVGSVPYVTASKQIKRGTLVSTLELQQERTVKPGDHTVYFIGEVPCDQHGAELPIVNDKNVKVALRPDVVATCQFSSKPWPNGYTDYYEKLTTYIKLLLHEAQAIDPSVKAKVFRPVRADENDEAPFHYLDTSSSRAGIGGLNQKLAVEKIAIVGLGGTGAYVLDFVAKTHAKEIHLFDDDEFKQHNAFRCPGAVGFDELTDELTKVGYYHGIYSKLRRGIVPHPYRIGADNVVELAGMGFVFLCLDTGELKDTIMRSLEDARVPFVDVGMGVELAGDALTGILRVTTSTPGKREHIRENERVSFAPATGDNLYSRNIQVVELNAINAALAVIRWKKYCGFYLDLKHEHHTTFSISTNRLANEDHG